MSAVKAKHRGIMAGTLKLHARRCVCALAAAAVAGLLVHSAAEPQAARKRPGFRDIAPQSKFSYISNNDFSRRKYFQQPMCGGVAVLDYDNDGLTDIFFTNGARLPELKKTNPSFYNCLLRNRSDGTFEDVTAKAGVAGENLDFSYGVAAGDYDNDGWTDLFIANTGKNTLYHNKGDGTFSDVTDESGLASKPPETLSVQGAWFDYDNDGLLDLVLSNYTLWTPEKDRRCLRGDVDVYCSPTTYTRVPHRLYHNLGSGKFEDVTGTSGFGKTLGQGHGDRHCRLQHRRLDGRLHRQRHRAEFPVHQSGERHVQGVRPTLRRCVQRRGRHRFGHGLRCQGLRQ